MAVEVGGARVQATGRAGGTRRGPPPKTAAAHARNHRKNMQRRGEARGWGSNVRRLR